MQTSRTAIPVLAFALLLGGCAGATPADDDSSSSDSSETETDASTDDGASADGGEAVKANCESVVAPALDSIGGYDVKATVIDPSAFLIPVGAEYLEAGCVLTTTSGLRDDYLIVAGTEEDADAIGANLQAAGLFPDADGYYANEAFDTFAFIGVFDAVTDSGFITEPIDGYDGPLLSVHVYN